MVPNKGILVPSPFCTMPAILATLPSHPFSCVSGSFSVRWKSKIFISYHMLSPAEVLADTGGDGCHCKEQCGHWYLGKVTSLTVLTQPCFFGMLVRIYQVETSIYIFGLRIQKESCIFILTYKLSDDISTPASSWSPTLSLGLHCHLPWL